MIFGKLSQAFILSSFCTFQSTTKSLPFIRRQLNMDHYLELKGLLIGAFTTSETSMIELANVENEVDPNLSRKVTELVNRFGGFPKETKRRLFYDLSSTYPLVCVVDLGRKNAGINILENRDDKKENIRAAVAGGVRTLMDAGAAKIIVASCSDQESVAEAVHLVLYRYDELKNAASKRPKIDIGLASQRTPLWEQGFIKADAQNFARGLMEAPSNYMRPVDFVAKVSEKIKGKPIDMFVRNKQWAEEKKMGSFLSVSKGSHEPPAFVELHYNGGGNKKPIVFVGKGITFDSGGISIKVAASMDKMRADMGGAAVVAASVCAAAELQLNLNIKALIPLCENMPGGGATKPGDVVYAMNGTSIQVDNTDAEGRLILADGLCYAQSFQPEMIIDVATLTGAMQISLGGAATGVFSNDDDLYSKINRASIVTGDRVWRMPLFECYSKKIKHCPLADLNNISGSRYAGSCVAAAFLKEFVGNNKWMHFDIAGVMENDDDVPYLSKGMSGRPVRTFIEFLKMLSS